MKKDKHPETNKDSPVPSVVQEKVLIKQVRTLFGSLIGAGLVMTQPFLSSGAEGLAAQICVISFAVAIPLLATLFALNYEENTEDFHKRIVKSPLINLIKVIAQFAALIGLIAGFWHMHILAGIGMIIASAVGIVAYYKFYK